jgi:hypothetical protein
MVVVSDVRRIVLVSVSWSIFSSWFEVGDES